MESNYKKLGQFVRQVSNFNSNMLITELKGINIFKEFISSVANTLGTDLSKYKVVHKNQFAYNPMHVGRDEILPIALLLNQNPIIVSPAYIVFEIINEKDILPEYLMLWSRRKEFDRNAWFTTDSSVRGGLAWKEFCNLRIYIPSIKKQKDLIKKYKIFTDRILLNQKLIQKLDDTAKTLFKSWFIDFDPVKAKSEGRSTGLPDEISALFPDSFEESELGQIPNSWDTKKIADWGETICGKTPSTKNESYYGNDYMFVTIPDLHKGLHVTSSSKGLSKSGAELQSKKLLSKGSILVSCIATPGLIGVIQESCFTNQQINSITPNNKNCTWFIAFFLLMNKDLLLSFGGGGSVFFNLNKSKFDSIEVISPPVHIIEKFNQFVSPLMDKCFAIKREISFLSNIRDTLLPRLISGELRIPNPEKIMEEGEV